MAIAYQQAAAEHAPVLSQQPILQVVDSASQVPAQLIAEHAQELQLHVRAAKLDGL